MLIFRFIKKTLGLQEKDHVVGEIDGKILKLVVSEDTIEQVCPACGLKTTRFRDYRTQHIETISVETTQLFYVKKT